MLQGAWATEGDLVLPLKEIVAVQVEPLAALYASSALFFLHDIAAVPLYVRQVRSTTVEARLNCLRREKKKKVLPKIS